MSDDPEDVVDYAEETVVDDWGVSDETMLAEAPPINHRNRSHSIHIGVKSGNRTAKMKESDSKQRAKNNWGKLRANILKGKACRTFELDVNATNFATCKCGYPKTAHSKANSLVGISNAIRSSPNKKHQIETQKGSDGSDVNDIDEILSKINDGIIDFRSTTPSKSSKGPTSLSKRDSKAGRAQPITKYSWDSPDSMGQVSSSNTTTAEPSKSTGKDRRATPLVPFSSSKTTPKKLPVVSIEEEDDIDFAGDDEEGEEDSERGDSVGGEADLLSFISDISKDNSTTSKPTSPKKRSSFSAAAMFGFGFSKEQPKPPPPAVSTNKSSKPPAPPRTNSKTSSDTKSFAERMGFSKASTKEENFNALMVISQDEENNDEESEFSKPASKLKKSKSYDDRRNLPKKKMYHSSNGPIDVDLSYLKPPVNSHIPGSRGSFIDFNLSYDEKLGFQKSKEKGREKRFKNKLSSSASGEVESDRINDLYARGKQRELERKLREEERRNEISGGQDRFITGFKTKGISGSFREKPMRKAASFNDAASAANRLFQQGEEFARRKEEKRLQEEQALLDIKKIGSNKKVSETSSHLTSPRNARPKVDRSASGQGRFLHSTSGGRSGRSGSPRPSPRSPSSDIQDLMNSQVTSPHSYLKKSSSMKVSSPRADSKPSNASMMRSASPRARKLSTSKSMGETSSKTKQAPKKGPSLRLERKNSLTKKSPTTSPTYASTVKTASSSPAPVTLEISSPKNTKSAKNLSRRPSASSMFSSVFSSNKKKSEKKEKSEPKKVDQETEETAEDMLAGLMGADSEGREFTKDEDNWENGDEPIVGDIGDETDEDEEEEEEEDKESRRWTEAEIDVGGIDGEKGERSWTEMSMDPTGEEEVESKNDLNAKFEIILASVVTSAFIKKSTEEVGKDLLKIFASELETSQQLNVIKKIDPPSNEKSGEGKIIFEIVDFQNKQDKEKLVELVEENGIVFSLSKHVYGKSIECSTLTYEVEDEVPDGGDEEGEVVTATKVNPEIKPMVDSSPLGKERRPTPIVPFTKTSPNKKLPSTPTSPSAPVIEEEEDEEEEIEFAGEEEDEGEGGGDKEEEVKEEVVTPKKSKGVGFASPDEAVDESTDEGVDESNMTEEEMKANRQLKEKKFYDECVTNISKCVSNSDRPLLNTTVTKITEELGSVNLHPMMSQAIELKTALDEAFGNLERAIESNDGVKIADSIKEIKSNGFEAFEAKLVRQGVKLLQYLADEEEAALKALEEKKTSSRMSFSVFSKPTTNPTPVKAQARRLSHMVAEVAIVPPEKLNSKYSDNMMSI